MKREELEKLDRVLNKLELIHVIAKQEDGLEDIESLSINAINILDELVPRPLPNK